MTALCPHFGVCGGCSRQDVPYEAQLAQKESLVRNALAGLEYEEFRPIWPSPEVYFYRNKMEFSFGDGRDLALISAPRGRGKRPSPAVPVDNRVHLGLLPKGRFAVVTPTPSCRLLSEESQKVVAAVGEWANRRGIPIYLRKD